MRTSRTAVLFLFLLVGRWAMAEGPLKLGEAIPMRDTKMESVDGRKLSIGEIAGAKGTLVIFACNHCPFVKAWEKRLTAIGNESRKKNIGVLVINANDPAAYPFDDMRHMKEQAKAAGFAFPYVMDETSDVARAFEAARTPEAFLFNGNGKLVYHGAIDDDAHHPDKVQKRYLQDALDALLAGKDIAVKETSSVGCSIKFRNKPVVGK